MLAGLRVLDLSNEWGQYCGKVFGDLGADVVMIEKPGGSPSRKIGPFYHGCQEPSKSLFWYAYNTNKRGISLDIQTQEGRKLFRELARTADFVIESFPPGYLDALGLGYDNLRKIKPSIILTSISPFGLGGPYESYKTCDIVALAMGGLMNLMGDPDRAPLRFSAEHFYAHVGSQAAAATMIAYHHRQVSGKGQHIDVSIQECIMATIFLEAQSWAVAGDMLKREGARNPRGPVSFRFIWPCKDGYISWRIFVAQSGSYVRRMVEWMEEEGMAGELTGIDWEKLDADKLEQKNLDRWEHVFAIFFRTHTKAELSAEALKRHIMLLPVNTVEDLLKDAQLDFRKFWVEIEHPELETKLTYPGVPLQSSLLDWKISRPPICGEHNDEVYGELGIPHEELLALSERNII